MFHVKISAKLRRSSSGRSDRSPHGTLGVHQTVHWCTPSVRAQRSSTNGRETPPFTPTRPPMFTLGVNENDSKYSMYTWRTPNSILLYAKCTHSQPQTFTRVHLAYTKRDLTVRSVYTQSASDLYFLLVPVQYDRTCRTSPPTGLPPTRKLIYWGLLGRRQPSPSKRSTIGI